MDRNVSFPWFVWKTVNNLQNTFDTETVNTASTLIYFYFLCYVHRHMEHRGLKLTLNRKLKSFWSRAHSVLGTTCVFTSVFWLYVFNNNSLFWINMCFVFLPSKRVWWWVASLYRTCKNDFISLYNHFWTSFRLLWNLYVNIRGIYNRRCQYLVKLIHCNNQRWKYWADESELKKC